MNTAHILTKQDIAAMRTANNIVIRYDRDQNIGRIEAIKNPSDKNPWEQVHCVPVTVNASAYSENYNEEVYRALEMLHYANSRYDDAPWHTIMDLVKPGDVLGVNFRANVGNDYTKDAGLYADDCSIVIIRPGQEAAKDKRYLFLLERSICQDNSAHMCKVRVRRDSTNLITA